MTVTRRISRTAAIVAALALLVAVSSRTGSIRPDVDQFFANRVVPAINAVSNSIAENPSEMVAP